MKNKSLFDSFSNALTGIIETFKNERNFRTHFFIAILVLLVTLFIDMNTREFLIILFAIVLVLTMELINTAVEAIVDLYCGETYHEKAKLAKDACAGAVFISSAYAAAAGYIIIFRKIVDYSLETLVVERIRQTPVFITFVCIVIALMLTIVIKALTGRKNLLSGGMPSAHSAVAFSAATCILFLTNDIVSIILAFFLAFLVAQSRIEGKIHSILQVALGCLLGALVTVLVFQLM
ncbi:MAG: diacylglycerol kinase [Clostridiales bacterium]|jgi:diacylglycerol kinase (ATP)|nr:diacylglycerol kinase [Clostridiales bacterium]